MEEETHLVKVQEPNFHGTVEATEPSSRSSFHTFNVEWKGSVGRLVGGAVLALAGVIFTAVFGALLLALAMVIALLPGTRRVQDVIRKKAQRRGASGNPRRSGQVIDAEDRGGEGRSTIE